MLRTDDGKTGIMRHDGDSVMALFNKRQLNYMPAVVVHSGPGPVPKGGKRDTEGNRIGHMAGPPMNGCMVNSKVLSVVPQDIALVPEGMRVKNIRDLFLHSFVFGNI